MPARGLLCAQNDRFDRRVDPWCRASVQQREKGYKRHVYVPEERRKASPASSDEDQADFAGHARPNVLRLPGRCQRWDERDADFIREILDLVGDKWSVLVIGVLAGGDARYSDLDTAIPAISPRMLILILILTLTLTLMRLQRSGLVDRTSYPQVPPRVEYSLTSLSASLLSAIEDLAAWSAEKHTEIRRHQNAYDMSDTA
jgi:DNA-binding HxlR family transcriptional regulator